MDLKPYSSSYNGNGTALWGGCPVVLRRTFVQPFASCRVGPLQMNLADSERIAGVLDAAGYACVERASDADVVIYNTCSIRDKAE